jgi:hypothetical protein
MRKIRKYVTLFNIKAKIRNLVSIKESMTYVLETTRWNGHLFVSLCGCFCFCLSFKISVFHQIIFIHSFIYSSVTLQPSVGPWSLLQSRNLFYVDGRTPWTSDQPDPRPLPTHRTPWPQNKRTQTCMPWVGFEPIIPAFEETKTIDALDRAATVIGPNNFTIIKSRKIIAMRCLPSMENLRNAYTLIC